MKKKRDLEQGLSVGRLLMEFMPQFPFTDSELRMFPTHVRNEAGRLMD